MPPIRGTWHTAHGLYWLRENPWLRASVGWNTSCLQSVEYNDHLYRKRRWSLYDKYWHTHHTVLATPSQARRYQSPTNNVYGWSSYTPSLHDGFITDGFPDVIRGIPHNQSVSDYMPDMNKEGISSSSKVCRKHRWRFFSLTSRLFPCKFSEPGGHAKYCCTISHKIVPAAFHRCYLGIP